MAAVIAPQSAGFWHHRADRSFNASQMNMSGMMTSYNHGPQNMSDAPSARSFAQTSSQLDTSLPLFPTNSMTTSVPYQSGTYAFESLSVNPYNMQQAFPVSYPPAMQHNLSYSGSGVQSLGSARDVRTAYTLGRSSPPVKAGQPSPMQQAHIYSDGTYPQGYRNPAPSKDENGISFTTHIDTLMKAIQAKERTDHIQSPSSPKEVESPKGGQKSRKKYHCSMPDCHKTFYQKTHLEIHIRSHTGHKPFQCTQPNCGQTFSQLGNLKTHERRHTGERPYRCEICGKTFAQRGNVRAHKIVHQQIKPFICRLDDCGKQFTQLGNLKSHQNKFHEPTLLFLTQKFASFSQRDQVNQEDMEMWDYFASLYKNSNKGIKGRGKDRRISAPPSTVSNASTLSASTMPALSARHYGMPFEHHTSSERGSRSSSLSSDGSNKIPEGYDFSAQIQPTYHGIATVYDDSAFPDRKFY